MKDNPSEKDLRQFKLTLFLLPVIPDAILLYKGHQTLSLIILCIFWGLLAITVIPKIIRINIDKFVYKFCNFILKILGGILAAVALTVTWFLAILPTALLAKMMKRDRLKLQKQNTKTYWKDVTQSEPTYENQF